ncbi:TPA: hypothetical protein ACH3X2_005959 [Trebouxia sp. C0005]
MVHLIRGVPHAGDAPKTDSFRQSVTNFRSRVSSNESSQFKPESGRYHLVVALQCPFAHRTLIMRSLKGLQDAITVDYVNPELTLEHGWIFSPTGKSGIDYPSCTRERSGLEPQAEYLYQLYQKGNSEFTGTISVPVLWDKKKQTVVNNDSGQIMEMLNSEFDEISQDSSCPDLFPKELQAELTELNDHMADSINTGVYKCGFAQSQEEYETPCNKLFDELDKLEKRLDGQRYLIPYHPEGRATPCPTLADYRLFTTLIRFDVVYYPLFKTNLRHIRDYPNLQGFMEDLYSDPAIASTVDFAQIKKGYWMSMNLHGPLNPKDRIPLNSEPFLPKGPFHRRALGLLEHSGKPATNGTGKDVTAAGRDEKSKGAFVRKESQHRNWIKADGSTSFTPEAGRYHLYVANGCPWCHRTALTRALLGMQDSVSMDVLFYSRDPDRGWQFKPEAPGCTPDTVNGGMHFIRELYEKENSGEKTVPVLFDKKTKTIVSNESADIIRMFATECQGMHGPGAPDLIPQQPQQLQQLETSTTGCTRTWPTVHTRLALPRASLPMRRPTSSSLWLWTEQKHCSPKTSGLTHICLQW